MSEQRPPTEGKVAWGAATVAGAIALGLFAGAFGAFLGIGGGVIFVPALIYLFRVSPHDAAATSLAIIVFLALSSAITDIAEGTARLSVAGYVTVGAVIGSYGLGVPLAGRVSGEGLKRLFGGLLLLVGLKIILAPQFGTSLAQPTPLVALAGGLAAGLVAGFFGVGGGVLLVPLLSIVYGLPQHQAHATSLCIIVPTVAAGLVKAQLSPERTVRWPLVWAVAPAAMVGAVCGVELREVFSNEQLRTIFAWVLLALSLRMMGLGELLGRSLGRARPPGPK